VNITCRTLPFDVGVKLDTRLIPLPSDLRCITFAAQAGRFLPSIARAVVFVLLFSAILRPAASGQTEWSVGYWGTVDMNPSHSMPVSSLNGQWDGLTHMVIGSLIPKADGTVYYQDPNYATNIPLIVNAAHANGTKVLIDVFDQDGQMAVAIRDHLKTLLTGILRTVHTFRFDGVEIDWEQRFNQMDNDAFLPALRSALGSSGLIMEGADINLSAYYGGRISTYLDKVSPGLYDMGSCIAGGTWFDQALHNYPSGIGNSNRYWSYDLVRTRFLTAGVPPAKLMFGMSFLGKIYTKGSPAISGPRQNCGSGYQSHEINYNSLINTYNLSSLIIDSVTGEPWMPVSGGWMNVENGTSVASKVAYNRQYNLGGWFMFNLFADYMPLHDVKHPLLEAVQAAMGTNRHTAPPSASISSLRQRPSGRRIR
jgi:Glycosyl hydrolases family 18